MVHSNVEMYSFGLFGICFILGQSNLANPDLKETDRRCRERGCPIVRFFSLYA